MRRRITVVGRRRVIRIRPYVRLEVSRVCRHDAYRSWVNDRLFVLLWLMDSLAVPLANSQAILLRVLATT